MAEKEKRNIFEVAGTTVGKIRSKVDAPLSERRLELKIGRK